MNLLAPLLRRRGLERCFGPAIRESLIRRPARPAGPIHVLLCMADHFEPKRGGASLDLARRRVAFWREAYPRVLGGFRDRDGRFPRHTFFFPAEEYESELLDPLAELCRDGFGEVEIHLHHDHDTADNLRRTLEHFKTTLADRHGLLGRRRDTGEPVFGFIHGNWALDNARPDGRMCGVNNELDVLRESGCYADFTMPSAPGPCQTRAINQIYWAVDDPDRPMSHDQGVPLGTAPRPPDSLLMIQGPLMLDWRHRRRSLLPRIENGCLQGNQPPTIGRLETWLRAQVQVPTRPDWFFVKLYTHGAEESNRTVLLGDSTEKFHRDLADRMATDPDFHLHYVSARELANLALAAEAGWTGSVNDARDFAYFGIPGGSCTGTTIEPRTPVEIPS